jgi:hypothetical protein
MYCPNCGKELSDQAAACPNCGHPIQQRAAAPAPAGASPKSRLAALLFCVFLGGIGVHRFYVGKVGTGVAMIFTLGGLGIWVLIDIITIATGSFKDIDGRLVSDWQV